MKGVERERMSESGSEETESSEEEEEEDEEEGSVEDEDDEEQGTQLNSKKSIQDDLELLADISGYVHLTAKRIATRLPEYIESMSSLSTTNSKKKTKEKKKPLPIKSRGLVDRAVDLLMEDMDSTSLDESLKEEYPTVSRRYPPRERGMAWRGEGREDRDDERLS
jgi:hypothetical protein